MTIGDSSEVRPDNYYNCDTLGSNLDMITNEIQKVIDEYNKLSQEKKSC